MLIGRIVGLLVISVGLVSPSVAQKPSQAQINAVRQACPADYQTYCSSVPTGGSASLACLKRNAQSLSEPCREAVAAISSPAPAAQNPRPAAAPSAPAAPAARTSGPPMSRRQEAMLLRRSCGMDYRTYCSEVPIGGGRVIECLKENGPSLSRQCRSALMSARQGR
jgi:hypothetical protein